MKYFVTNVSSTQYTSEAVTIKPSKEVEVSKETYDYLNEVFGTSGKFTFRTEGKAEPKKKVKAKKEVETKEVETKEVETKTKSKK